MELGEGNVCSFCGVNNVVVLCSDMITEGFLFFVLIHSGHRVVMSGVSVL